MPLPHPGGPKYSDAGHSCALLVQSCRRLRRNASAPAVVHALARGVQQHALVPLEYSCADAISNPSFANRKNELVESMLVDLLPSLGILIAVAESNSSCISAAVLSCAAEQFYRVQRGSPAIAVITSIWRDVFAAYSIHIRQWLQDGTVHDGSNDFFICRDPTGVHASNPGMPPGHAFYVAYDRLPSFVSRASADRIFFAGNVVNCIKRYGHQLHEREKSSRAPLRPPTDHESALLLATFKRMTANGSSICLALEAGSIAWRNSASLRMSRLISEAGVERYIRALRGYLLLGNELFWRSFFDRLRPVRHMMRSEMSKEEVEAANRSLLHIVESSLGDTDTDARIPCILTLSVGQDGLLAPSFEIPFPASAIIAPSAGSYSEVFSVIFAVRRVALELERCYAILASELKKLGRSSACRDADADADADVDADVDVDVDIARQQFLRKCVLLRMRMGRFIQAFDDYLQADVFETSYRVLLREVGDAFARGGALLFDQIVGLHAHAVCAWVSQSLAGVNPVQRRLDAICECCLSLCELVSGVVEGRDVMDWREGGRIESIFDQNADLLLRVVSCLQGKAGSTKVSSLLLRLDWYRRFLGENSESRCRQEDLRVFSNIT